MRQRAYVKISLRHTGSLGRESCSSRKWKGKAVSLYQVIRTSYRIDELHRLHQYQIEAKFSES